MTPTMPSLTVIIPTYNRADVLPDAIRSVLEQSRDDVQVVVVDDGSEDNTEEVARGFDDRVTYIWQKNQGVSTARNNGVLHSSGDYLLFLDSDDVILPGSLEKLSAALDANPDCGAAYCGWRVTEALGNVSRVSSLRQPGGTIFRHVATDYLTIVHCGMVRRDCLAKSGLFDANLNHYEDIDFWMRMAANWRFVFVPRTLVEYRQWRPGTSKDLAGAAPAKAVMLKKLDIYRQLGWISDDWMLRVRARVFSEDVRTPAQKCAAEAREAYKNGRWRKACGCIFEAFRSNPRMLVRRSMWLLALRAAWRSLTRLTCRAGNKT